MNHIDEINNRELISVFDYIKVQLVVIGLRIHMTKDAKQTLQFYKDEQSISQPKSQLGAIQYEGSNPKNYSEKEPNLVNFRFIKKNLPEALKVDLEKITEFRCDTNLGSPIDPSATSIAFKFHKLEENEKSTIEEIICLLREHKKTL